MRVGDAAGDQVVTGGGRTAGAERDVVLAGAALSRMAFDRDGVTGEAGEPGGLLVERGAGFRVRSVESTVKKTRSPTLTTKSCWLPGVRFNFRYRRWCDCN